ncbi:hypothetical protein HYW75_00180 [Candidatus Pacearchaeota archaeon]|nr:hypothetical protein [Candidatus Pacearchaeota archaeon]
MNLYNYQISREYKSYRHIFQGIDSNLLREALEYHRKDRTLTSTFLLSIGFINESLHILALEDELLQRDKQNPFQLK